jgi:hypothetical protein
VSTQLSHDRSFAPAPPLAAPLLQSWLPSWPLWVALAAFVRLLAQPRAVLNDPDTYLHIAAGRWMWAHLALPTVDPFSYTMAGAHWLPGEWLAELAMNALYRAFGWNGIVLASAASFALAIGLLCHYAMRRTGPLPAVFAALAGAAVVLPHVVARPHLLAMSVLVLWAGTVFRARDDAAAPPWWVLPAMVLWANLHASFLFGIGLAGWLGIEAAVTAGRGRRSSEMWRWGAFVAASAAAAMLNPNGIWAFLQPLRMMAMPALQASFGEWLPPDFAQFPALELWLLAAMALGLGLGVRLPPFRLGLVLVLVHMALRHVRHADLLGLVGPLLMAAPIGEALARHATALSGLTLWRAAARLAGPVRWRSLVVALGLGTAAAMPLVVHPLARDDDAVTPADAIAAARRLGLAGPVLNSESFGGYLAFAGVPDFIDGRIEMFGNRFLADDVAAESGDAAMLARLLAEYRIGWTLLAPQAGAVTVLDRLPGWRRVYADRFAVIHARTGAAGP